MSKIELTDTPISMLVKMSNGNPGAVVAMTEIIKEHDKIDPQAAFGGIGAILLLDTWEIYGTEIYILYNDKCNRDVRRMLLLLRATQLGFFSHLKLKEMAEDQSRQINLSGEEWEKIDSEVCKQLDQFQKAA